MPFPTDTKAQTLIRLSNLPWADEPPYPFDIMKKWAVREPRGRLLRGDTSAFWELWGALCFLCPSKESSEWDALMDIASDGIPGALLSDDSIPPSVRSGVQFQAA